MAKIDPAQDYDMIHTLSFEVASGTATVSFRKGSTFAESGTGYYRGGTTGSWTPLSISGLSTTFPITDTVMQFAHNWAKDFDNYLTACFAGSSNNLTSVSISQKAIISGVIGNAFMYNYLKGCSGVITADVPLMENITSIGASFMYGYAKDCTNLIFLNVPNISTVTAVGNGFMAFYADGCSSLATLAIPDTSNLLSVGSSFMTAFAQIATNLSQLILPKAGYFIANNINWTVHSLRLGVLKGRVLDDSDLIDWQSLVTSGKTLYTNYIRSALNVTPTPLISLVNNTVGKGNINTATTPAIDTTGANCLVIAIGRHTGGATPIVTDSKGNTWIPLTNRPSSGDPASQFFYCVNPNVGTGHSFTVTATGAYPVLAVQAFQGVDQLNPFDKESGFGSTSAATSIQAGSVTPDTDGSVVIATVANTTNTTHGINEDFIITNQTPWVSSVNMGVGMAYKTQFTAIATNPTWTSSASGFLSSAILVLRPATTPPPVENNSSFFMFF